MMQNFLWQMAGADLQILKRSNNESKRSFLLVGVLYLLVSGLTFWAFFGLFWGVFDSFLISCFASSLLTFLISNIYRLNMMSLEPPSLPVPKSRGSVSAAIIVRYVIIALFAMFISKAFETSILGHLVDSELHEELMRVGNVNKFNESKMFVQHGVLLNKYYPQVWGITLVVVLIFSAPIYIKRKLFGGQEYFRIKYRNDVALVEASYDEFMDELHALHRKTYRQFGELRKHRDFGHQIPEKYDTQKYEAEESNYEDPPFNTRRKKIEPNLDSHKEFMWLDWK